MKFVKTIIIGGLTCLSLAGFLGHESFAQKCKSSTSIYLKSDSLNDFKNRVEIGTNFAYVKHPTKNTQENLTVEYIDFDEDSKIDMYSISLFESKTFGKRLSTFWNKQFSQIPSWGKIMEDDLQKIIDKEYQNLREKSEIPDCLHLRKEEKFGEHKSITKDTNGFYTILRVSHPSFNRPYLEVEYYSEDSENLTVKNYSVSFVGNEGTVVLADIKREDMDEIMQKDMDQQYRMLKEE